MPRTLLCLVRHGETNWNIERRHQGWLDIALNARGRAQAAALAEELAGVAFDAVYSSDLSRARDTAAPVAALRGLAATALAALREKRDGLFEGYLHAEAEALFPQEYRRCAGRDPAAAPPGGESLDAFAARIGAALADIARRHAGQTVLVVAHAGALDIAWRLARGVGFEAPRAAPLLNAAPNWLAFEDGAWSILRWAAPAERPAVAAPWDGCALERREAARLIVLNEANEALLLRYSSRLSPHFFDLGHDVFWGAPGGALEPGEDFAGAARREMFEETGLRIGELGAPFASRHFPMQLGARWMLAVERYFLIRAARFAPAPQGLTAAEKSHVLDFAWRSAEDVAASRELIFPEGLAALLGAATRKA